MLYLVVELSVQPVRSILCSSSFLLPPPLHLWQILIDPGEETKPAVYIIVIYCNRNLSATLVSNKSPAAPDLLSPVLLMMTSVLHHST